MTAPLNRLWSTGFSSLGCAELNLHQMFALAKEFNISHVELRFIEDTVDLPKYFAEKFPALEVARQLFVDAGMTIDCLGSSFKWIGAPAGGREEFINFCKLADGLNVPYVRVFGGSAWGTPLTDEDYEAAANEYRWWETERDRHGWNVQAVTETHDAFSASQPILNLMDRLQKRIPIIWDTHHTWRYAGESLQHSWNLLKESVVHMHFKDGIGTPSARHFFTYVLPGAGEFPIKDLQSILAENAYSGTVSLEWERKWHPYLPELKMALQDAKNLGWI